MAFYYIPCTDIGRDSMRKVKLKLGKRSYDIIICYDKLEYLVRAIKHLGLGKSAVIVTNPYIKNLFVKRLVQPLLSLGIDVKVETVPDGEHAKSEKTCFRLLNNISMFDKKKHGIFIIALGGGVVGDLAGFVASIYKRGIPYIQVPTTLLAQVDSAIGGKVAIDLRVGKNLAGSFYQPRLVFSDVAFLKTLSRRSISSGMAEVIKYGIIKSSTLFDYIEKNYQKIFQKDEQVLQHIIYECSSIKAGIVQKDELDNKGIRIILNLGHTIGHAIETASHYSRRYTHGEAIGLGILASSYISEQLGLLDKDIVVRIATIIKKMGLPTSLKGVLLDDILNAYHHDKKFKEGTNRFILPVKIGKVVVKQDVPLAIIKRSIRCLL